MRRSSLESNQRVKTEVMVEKSIGSNRELPSTKRISQEPPRRI